MPCSLFSYQMYPPKASSSTPGKTTSVYVIFALQLQSAIVQQSEHFLDFFHTLCVSDPIRQCGLREPEWPIDQRQSDPKELPLEEFYRRSIIFRSPESQRHASSICPFPRFKGRNDSCHLID